MRHSLNIGLVPGNEQDTRINATCTEITQAHIGQTERMKVLKCHFCSIPVNRELKPDDIGEIFYRKISGNGVAALRSGDRKNHLRPDKKWQAEGEGQRKQAPA